MYSRYTAYRVLSGLFMVALFLTSSGFAVTDPDLTLTSLQTKAFVRDVSQQPESFILPRTPLDISPADKNPGITLRHPVIGRSQNGILLRSYESDTGGSPDVYWQYSTDAGASWSNPVAFPLSDGNSPALDYWGANDTFLGTFVPNTTLLSGGVVVVFEFPDGADSLTWAGWFTDYSDNGWFGMSAADIAVDFSQESWNWGFITLVMHKQLGLNPILNAPHIFSTLNSTGVNQLSYYPQYPGCRATANAIDRPAAKTYAVYDRSAAGRWELFVRQDFYDDWYVTPDAARVSYSDTTLSLAYPDIAADNGRVLVVAETYSSSDTTAIDIVCWGTDSGDVDSLSIRSIVVSGASAERFPHISQVGGDQYVCTFHADGQLWGVESFDGGFTWDAPFRISGLGDDVPVQYQASDLSEDGITAIWNYVEAGDTLIDVGDVSCADSDGDTICDTDDNCPETANTDQVDTDGDTVGDVCDQCPGFDDLADADSDDLPDGCDNCPETANTDQADFDSDGIGDVCDSCTDSDGDGAGDPGFAANTCPEDNCPDNSNPTQADIDSDGYGDACDNCPGTSNSDQADADNDGIGDACDTCTDTDGDGFGNPGFPANTCGEDNCPYTYNPDQTDTDGDGQGDICELDVCGDADNNGEITIGDAIRVINYVFKGGTPPEPLEAGDANCSGSVDVGDVVYLINYIFASGPAPCCP